MLTETGRVVAVEQDALWVETIRKSTCGACAASKGCGHGLLNRIGDGRSGYVRVLSGDVDADQCVVDDRVRFGIPEQVILRGSALMYMLPLSCMLGGGVAAQALWHRVAAVPGLAAPELFAAIGAVAGLALGFALVRWHAWRHRDDRRLQPILLAILRSRERPVAAGTGAAPPIHPV